MFRKSLAVFDTGARMNFVRKSSLADGWNLSLKPKPTPGERDANKEMFGIVGVIDLIVRFGHQIVKIEFNVCERLSAPFINESTFIDRFVEAINPKKRRILLVDGTVAPIVRRPIDNPPQLEVQAEEISMVLSKDRRVQLDNPVFFTRNSKVGIC